VNRLSRAVTVVTISFDAPHPLGQRTTDARALGPYLPYGATSFSLQGSHSAIGISWLPPYGGLCSCSDSHDFD
jgi:hypothetical protein